MYESWYLEKYGQYNDFFNGDFDVFGLKKKSSDTRLTQLERLDDESIFDWIEDRDPDNEKASTPANLKLLLTRHMRHQHHEVKPWYMAFNKKSFQRICGVMNLPSDYLFLRQNAAGCGTYQKHTTFNNDGATSRLGFTIRVPHSPRNNAKATWSMGISWDAITGQTNALFEGVSDADIQDVQNYLQSKSELASHPLLLPMMILELLNIFFIDHRRELERSLFVLEHQLGVTRGRRQTDVWDWDYELHRESTKHCNVIYTGLVYLERRLEFAIGLAQFILDCLASLEDENLIAKPKQSTMMRETVINNSNFAKGQQHQGICLQKRCQALTTVMFTVIAQQDSKTNIKIAKSVKRDSTSMTAIAVLGFTFLPAMLIASMFSMSMFDFTTPTLVTNNFWLYWVVTIPVTLTILGVYRFWIKYRNGKDKKESESLKKERGIVVQSSYEASLAQNTPFYPGKGPPGHVF